MSCDTDQIHRADVAIKKVRIIVHGPARLLCPMEVPLQEARDIYEHRVVTFANKRDENMVLSLPATPRRWLMQP